jgi:hypothetical protein
LGGGPPKERLAVDATEYQQFDPEIDLAIEEKRRSLRLEKRLAYHHRALSAILHELELQPVYEAETALTASLWHLGVAIVQVARS